MDQKQNRNFSWGTNSPKNSIAYSNSDVINYPVYFFRPVEIDGKLWVPQPVFPEMLNWDQQKGQFNIPSAFGPAQKSQPINIPTKQNPMQPFRDEAPQTPVVSEPEYKPVKPKLRPIPMKKATPAVASAVAGSFADVDSGPWGPDKEKRKVEFEAQANKFVAPKVNSKKRKPTKKKIKAKPKISQEKVVDFTSSSVKAVKSSGALSKLLRILLWIFIILFIYFEVMLFASKPNENGDVSLVFGKGVVQQDTKDMYPAINNGDLCFIGQDSSYSVNSIIAYVNDDNKIIIHRYLGVDTSGNARAKADTSKVVDDSFSRSSIIGKVDFVLPFAGFLVSFLVDKIILVLLVVSLVACYIWKAKRKHT